MAVVLSIHNSILSHLANNIASILITIVLTSIGIVLSARYIRKNVASAKRERQKQAKEDVVRTLEIQLVNNEKIPENSIRDFVFAAERKHDVDFAKTVSSISILQDLQVRIAESRHLDNKRKQIFTEYLAGTIANLKRERRTEISLILIQK